MSFPYTTGIPNPTNSPQQDVPNMQINTNTISDWVAVDHVGFGNSTSGQHTKLTFPNVLAIPPAPTGDKSIIYTSAGYPTPAPPPLDTAPQAMITNSAGNFLLSCVKAFGVFTATTVVGDITPGNQFNVDSIACTVPGTITITLVTGAINASSNTNNTVVLLSSTKRDTHPNFSVNGLVITLQGMSLPANFSFAVLQY